MFRSALIGCALFALSINLVMADTFKTKIKSVDDEKRTVTFEVEGKDKTFNLTKEAKIFSLGKAKKGTPAPEITATLSDAKDKEATVTTDKVDGKEVVTVIKIETAKKKKKKGT